MERKRGLTRMVAAVLLGSVPAIAAALPAGATVRTGAGADAVAVAPVSCTSSAHPALAAKIARDIQAARRGRVSAVAVGVDDPGLRLTCWVSPSTHFDSASVVKATILGALLRKAMDQHRFLTGSEVSLARAMITRSDNNAASALWARVGRSSLQRFLNLARMTQTILGPGGFWGLTQITAHDEITLLRVLLYPNSVLDTASRTYELHLMAQVIASQRWGVPAGAPTGLTVHVKNGWLPRATHGWRIHSIGGFTGHGRSYSIVVLTQNNPTMGYGIVTIEAIARAIHRDLNPAATSVIPPSAPSPSWNAPDERIPAMPDVP
jgi:Beta-lactamase enzyme family